MRKRRWIGLNAVHYSDRHIFAWQISKFIVHIWLIKREKKINSIMIIIDLCIKPNVK